MNVITSLYISSTNKIILPFAQSIQAHHITVRVALAALILSTDRIILPLARSLRIQPIIVRVVIITLIFPTDRIILLLGQTIQAHSIVAAKIAFLAISLLINSIFFIKILYSELTDYKNNFYKAQTDLEAANRKTSADLEAANRKARYDLEVANTRARDLQATYEKKQADLEKAVEKAQAELKAVSRGAEWANRTNNNTIKDLIERKDRLTEQNLEIRALFLSQYDATLTATRENTQLRDKIHQLEAEPQTCIIHQKPSSIASSDENITGLNSLPDEVIIQILNCLSVEMIFKAARVNYTFYNVAISVLMFKAKRYGFRGDNPAKSKIYLQTLFKGLKSLALRQVIPRKYWQGNYTNLEETFRQIKEPFYTQSPTFRKESKEALLEYAANGQAHLLLALLQLGIDPHIWKSNQERALILATENNHESVVEILLDRGANPNICDLNFTPLIINAFLSNKHKLVQIFLDKNVDINVEDVYKNTLLIYAVRNNDLPFIKKLFKAGALATLVFKNHIGGTALHYAAGNGYSDILEFFLQHIPREVVNTNLPEYGTPLHQAALKGQLECIELLHTYNAGKDLKIPDNGYTPADLAREHKQLEALQLLEASPPFTCLAWPRQN